MLISNFFVTKEDANSALNEYGDSIIKKEGIEYIAVIIKKNSE